MDNATAQLLRKIQGENAQLRAVMNQLMSDMKKLQAKDNDPIKQLNEIDGRRCSYFLTGSQSFTTAQDGARGADISMIVSQDGPFIWTHWPVVMWRPNAPSTATNLGVWRPVYSWPLPDQVEDADLINLSWEIRDGGSQRLFQSESMPPMFSYPGALHPLPFPTVFAPNSSLVFTPIYENIAFDTGDTATTGGLLKVLCPGFRIVNM